MVRWNAEWLAAKYFGDILECDTMTIRVARRLREISVLPKDTIYLVPEEHCVARENRDANFSYSPVYQMTERVSFLREESASCDEALASLA